MTGELGDPRLIPVIVGTGQVNDRAATGAEGLDSLGLMVEAARRAGADAGSGLLTRTDWLGITGQISFPALRGTLVEGVSTALGIAPACARETPAPTGDSPILLLNEAANAIGSGNAAVALVTGGEALRTAGKRKAEAAAAGEERKGPYPRREPRMVEPRHAYGLITPTDVYPLFENAARAKWGQSLAEAQVESALIWAGMSRVAAGCEHAWLREAVAPDDVITASPANRPIAFPYTKLQVANAAVNQGAALLVTSLATAREAGIAEDRLVYLARGAAAHEDEDPLQRPDFASSASMATSLTRALQFNGLEIGAIDHIELYSCFPVVPKMARRVLGVPADRPMTMFGGLTFGGGPIGNYMAHAAACMVEALRASGTHGLLFANGGYATHNHTMVLTRVPQAAGTFPQDFDVQAEADQARGAVPSLDAGHTGPATLETYTVLFDRDGAPRHGVVVARCSAGVRTLALVPREDDGAIARLLSGEATLIGAPGTVVREGETGRWQFAG